MKIPKLQRIQNNSLSGSYLLQCVIKVLTQPVITKVVGERSKKAQS